MVYALARRDRCQAAWRLGAVLALHGALIYGLLNGLDSGFSGHPPPPPMLTRILAAPPPPPPPPPELQAPDLAAPPVFVPKLELPAVPPPPSQPPTNVTHTPAPQSPAVAAALPPAPDTSFSPSALRGGTAAPAYPEEYAETPRAGRVNVACTIETTGVPTHCRVLSVTGGDAFATATLRWLTAPGHPIYRPAMKAGRPQREDHQWVVQFEPPAGEDP